MQVRYDVRRRPGLIGALALCVAWALSAAAGPAPASPSTPPASSAAPAAAQPAASSAPSPPASGGAAPPSSPNLADLNVDRQLLATLLNRLPSETNDRRLADMERQAAAVEASVDSRVAAADSQLAGIEATIRADRFDRRRWLSRPDLQKKAALLAQQAALEAQLAQLQPAATQASRTYSDIAERRRESFSARVLQQTASPLSPDFWTSLARNAGADIRRLDAMADLNLDAAIAAPEPRGAGGLGLGALACFLLLVPVRMLLGRLGWRLCRRFGPAARTVSIAWTVVVDVGMAVLGAGAVRLGLQWGGLLAPSASYLARAAVAAVVWAAAVVALGRALATDSDPAHRLLKVDDGEALRGRVSLFIVALVTAAGLFLQKLDYIVGASVAAAIATDCAISLAYAATMLLLLITFSPRDAETAPHTRTPGRTVISLLLAAATVLTVGAVLFGYATLAALISGQVFWLSLIAATTWLVLKLIDDLCRIITNEHSRTARALANLLGLKLSTVIQVGLLACAALQLVIIFAAVTLALTPFGQSGELLVGHIRKLGAAVHIGKATISPLALALGLITFGFGVSLAHLARGWLERRYLPATDWDAGVRNSVSTGVAYLGVAVALLCALGVTGLGFRQIALVASALSVGIGFGLQQIVQNFVAGIILLIERPVKVGDWVSVSGVEGDILDIRVRATEIRTFDCSTVIVPNSNLITSNVQNKTVGYLRTRVDMQVNVAKPADAQKARELMLKLASGHKEILKDPAPAVYLENLAGGGAAQLTLWFYLPDPREIRRVKSEMYFAVLDEFQKSQVAFQ